MRSVLSRNLALSRVPWNRWTPSPLGFPCYIPRDFTSGARDSTTQLTRVMVRRMRLADIQQELAHRGIVAEKGKKRIDLMLLLLNELPKRSSTTHLHPSVVSKEQLCEDTAVVPQSSESEQNASDSYCIKYDIEKLDLDRTKQYTVATKGVIRSDVDGIGIGIVLRDENDNIVWMAQKYYTESRSLLEAGYCAVILAMRYVLNRFGLSSVVVQTADFTIYDQISGLFDTKKPSLQLLRGEIMKLQWQGASVGKNISHQVAPKAQRVELEQLALDALMEQKSLNLGDEDDDSHDPMDKIPPSALVKIDSEAEPSQPDMTTTVVVDRVIDPSKVYVLRFDGGSRGNPGIAGAGMVLYNDQGQEIWHGRKYLGRSISNNKAEYCAIHLGLRHAQSIGIERVRCEGDSELVIKQLQGIYKVKSENLRHLWNETHSLMKSFRDCEVQHILREFNKRADFLANEGLRFHVVCWPILLGVDFSNLTQFLIHRFSYDIKRVLWY